MIPNNELNAESWNIGKLFTPRAEIAIPKLFK